MRRLRGLVLPHVDQVDESDLAVLRRLARDLDLVARPVAGELVVAPRHGLAEGRPAAAPVNAVGIADDGRPVRAGCRCVIPFGAVGGLRRGAAGGVVEGFAQ